jgi:predicted dehydrogenase
MIQEESLPMKTVRFTIVGFGNIAKTHATALRALPVIKRLPCVPILDSLVTRSPAKQGLAAKAAGFEYVTDTLEEVLAVRDSDVVDICTPNSLHLSAFEASSAAGKAVYCEKPLTEQVERSRELAARAANDPRHQVALVYRYHPAVMRVKAALEAGLIGDVLQFRIAYLRSGYLNASRPVSWRLDKPLTGGGAISDLGVHVLDLVRHLFGEIVDVTGDTQIFVKRRPASADDPRLVDIDVDDWALMHVQTAGGVRGTAEVSRIAWGSEGFWLQLYGTNGSIVCNLEKDTVPAVRLLNGSSPAIPEPAELALLPDEKTTMGIAVDCHAGALHHFMLRLAGEDRYPELAPTIGDCLSAEEWIDRVLSSPISRASARIGD